ncbi:MAG TPA: ADOP family duplicated permease [Vicinamibacterales bacterium]|jgi:predicted permease
MDQLLNDIRHGARILTKSPGLSATAALLIALVIGGNATIYSMVNGMVRRPAPGVMADDLVSFGLVGRAGAPYHRYGDIRYYAEHSKTLRSLTAFGYLRASVATPKGTHVIPTIPASTNYFETLGIAPVKGRTFRPDEGRTGAPLVAVISDRVWREYYQSADDVVGMPISINGQPATVIGVTPPKFAGAVLSETSDIWIPLGARRPIEDDNSMVMMGRLAEGSSIARARAEFLTLQSQLRAASPEIERQPLLVTPYAAAAGGVIAMFEREILALFSIVTLLTLMVVCANVANLMLARAVARQRETAVRQSLGASSFRIVRLLIVEGLVIASVAAIAAYAVATWAAALVPRALPQTNLTATMPTDFAPDWHVAVYAVVLAIIGTAIFSVPPALRASRQDPLPVLKEGGHGTIAGRSRISSGLVILQLSFSVLLLTIATLSYRSTSLLNLDLGYDATRLMIVGIGTDAAAQSREANIVVHDRIRERLRTLPGVTAVSYTAVRPPFNWTRDPVRVLGSSHSVAASINVVGPGYLDTFNVQPIAGRSLVAEDRSRAGIVAVINQNLARTLFSDRSAVGQIVQIGSDAEPVWPRLVRGRVLTAEVVGVAPNAYYSGFNIDRADTKPNHILLTDQRAVVGDTGFNPGVTGRTSALLLRFTGDFAALAAAVPSILSDVDPRVAIEFRETMQTRLDEQNAGSRLLPKMLLIFAGLSLLIAAIGQYAVAAFNMRRRVRDFGIRIALGASSRIVLGSVLREGAGLTLIGLAIGTVLSVGVATAMRGVLYGVTPTDPQTYVGVFVLLGCVSLIACYLPARRAASVDPVQALRQE